MRGVETPLLLHLHPAHPCRPAHTHVSPVHAPLMRSTWLWWDHNLPIVGASCSMEHPWKCHIGDKTSTHEPLSPPQGASQPWGTQASPQLCSAACAWADNSLGCCPWPRLGLGPSPTPAVPPRGAAGHGQNRKECFPVNVAACSKPHAILRQHPGAICRPSPQEKKRQLGCS